MTRISSQKLVDEMSDGLFTGISPERVRYLRQPLIEFVGIEVVPELEDVLSKAEPGATRSPVRAPAAAVSEPNIPTLEESLESLGIEDTPESRLAYEKYKNAKARNQWTTRPRAIQREIRGNQFDLLEIATVTGKLIALYGRAHGWQIAVIPSEIQRISPNSEPIGFKTIGGSYFQENKSKSIFYANLLSVYLRENGGRVMDGLDRLAKDEKADVYEYFVAVSKYELFAKRIATELPNAKLGAPDVRIEDVSQFPPPGTPIRKRVDLKKYLKASVDPPNKSYRKFLQYIYVSELNWARYPGWYAQASNGSLVKVIQTSLPDGWYTPDGLGPLSTENKEWPGYVDFPDIGTVGKGLTDVKARFAINTEAILAVAKIAIQANKLMRHFKLPPIKDMPYTAAPIILWADGSTLYVRAVPTVTRSFAVGHTIGSSDDLKRNKAVVFDAFLLEKLLSPRPKSSAAMTFTGNLLKPILIETQDPFGFSILMPMRGDFSAYASVYAKKDADLEIIKVTNLSQSAVEFIDDQFSAFQTDGLPEGEDSFVRGKTFVETTRRVLEGALQRLDVEDLVIMAVGSVFNEREIPIVERSARRSALTTQEKLRAALEGRKPRKIKASEYS